VSLVLSSSACRSSFTVALALALMACSSSVIMDGNGDGEGDGADGSAGPFGDDDGDGADDPNPVADTTFDPETVATSEAYPPTGVWTMTIQYGMVGEEVEPTIPLQVELRADGTAYQWICAGQPDDGSYDEVCSGPARDQCMIGTFHWDGTRWQFDFPALREVYSIPEMGRIVPAGEGRLLLSYINPTYSGALFRRLAEPHVGGASCAP
jgi:hypothetical protein